MIISMDTLNDLLEKYELELYDFGNGFTTIPIAQDGSYLTKSMIFVMKRLPGSHYLVMGIEIPLERRNRNGTFNFVDDIAARIAKRFSVAAHAVEGHELLPKTHETLASIQFDEKVENPRSEREVIVRKAIINLGRVGLRVSGFRCHPETFIQMVNESVLAVDLRNVVDGGKWEGTITAKNAGPMHTYCGIPVEQDANEQTQIS